jgi:hypothetical protein
MTESRIRTVYAPLVAPGTPPQFFTIRIETDVDLPPAQPGGLVHWAYAILPAVGGDLPAPEVREVNGHVDLPWKGGLGDLSLDTVMAILADPPPDLPGSVRAALVDASSARYGSYEEAGRRGGLTPPRSAVLPQVEVAGVQHRAGLGVDKAPLVAGQFGVEHERDADQVAHGARLREPLPSFPSGCRRRRSLGAEAVERERRHGEVRPGVLAELPAAGDGGDLPDGHGAGQSWTALSCSVQPHSTSPNGSLSVHQTRAYRFGPPSISNETDP